METQISTNTITDTEFDDITNNPACDISKLGECEACQ